MDRLRSRLAPVGTGLPLAVLALLLTAGGGRAVRAQAAGPKMIEHVPPIGWAGHKRGFMVAALQAAASAQGCPLPYEELMVTSGDAFRLCWWPGRYFYWTVDAMWPEDVVATAAAALGATIDRRTFNSSDEAWPEVCRSIDEGRPVVLWATPLFINVICGYEPHGRRMYVQPYDATSTAYSAKPFEYGPLPWPWDSPAEFIFVHYERGSRPPDLDWPEIVARAIRWADWPPTSKLHETSLCGLAAYDALAQTIRQGPDQHDPAVCAGVIQSASEILADARTCAAVVLRDHAAVHEAFAEAASHYEAEAVIVKPLFGVLAQLPADADWQDKRAAAGRNFARPEAREQAALLIEQAKAEEVQAVDALRRALKDLAAPQPPATEPKPLTTGPAPNAQQAEERYQRGLELKHAGQMTQAADELRAAIAADPKHAKAHYALAWVLLDLKDKGGARAEFQKVVELAPDSDEAKQAQQALQRLAR